SPQQQVKHCEWNEQAAEKVGHCPATLLVNRLQRIGNWQLVEDKFGAVAHLGVRVIQRSGQRGENGQVRHLQFSQAVNRRLSRRQRLIRAQRLDQGRNQDALALRR